MFINYLSDKKALNRNINDITFESLKRNGLHIFSELVPFEEIDALLSDFEILKQKNRISESGQSTGRISVAGVLTPAFERYVKKIKPYVTTFLNTERVRVEISYYQESYPQKNLESVPGGEFHVDDNKANFKYFIYLSDVGNNNGPFSCVPSTGSWRLKNSLIRGIFWEITGNKKYLYDYLIDTTYCEKNEKIITGTAGTQFLVDTTTLHRAKPVKEGCRKVLVISFNRDRIFFR
jgi:hypothetical protein